MNKIETFLNEKIKETSKIFKIDGLSIWQIMQIWFLVDVEKNKEEIQYLEENYKLNK